MNGDPINLIIMIQLNENKSLEEIIEAFEETLI